MIRRPGIVRRRTVSAREQRLLAFQEEESWWERGWACYGNAAAAVFRYPTLHLVKVRGSRGKYSLVEKACADFQLECRSSEALRSLRNEMSAFIRAQRIDRIAWRAGNHRGQYLPHPFAFKIEAMFDLYEDLEFRRVSSRSVTAWVGKEEVLLPLPQKKGTSLWRKAQAEAIDVAVYALEVGNFHDEFGEGECG